MLLKEMQSLSLNVEVLNAEGNKIELRDEDDEPASADDLGFKLNVRPNEGAVIEDVTFAQP